MTTRNEILYSSDARMSPTQASLAAAQHVIAMFIGCMTPALIFISSVDLDAATENYLISMSLFTAGLGTFLQARRFGFVGSGLLSVNGTSFAYLDLLLRAGNEGGLALACGMALSAVPLQFILAFFLPSLRRIFPPLVAGIVVLLIGLTLIPVAGYYITLGTEDGGKWSQNLILAASVAGVLIFSQVLGKPLFRMAGPIIAISLG